MKYNYELDENNIFTMITSYPLDETKSIIETSEQIHIGIDKYENGVIIHDEEKEQNYPYVIHN